MLTAWDKTHELTLALPDCQNRDQLEGVRGRARAGQLACPTCQQPLWLRAGELRIPHFGHRTLNDCPQGRVSEAVLAARHHLHRFFRARIDAGKLAAELELEPRVPDLGAATEIDLLVHRQQKPWVAVVIVETSLKPEVRSGLRSGLQRKCWLFRPVFLHSRLKSVPNEPEAFLLDTTERDFRISSPYELRPRDAGREPGTLHFIDTLAQSWTTLRALRLVHDPQLFESDLRRTSPLKDLLWSEAHSEWAHPGEAEALKAFLEAQAAEAKRLAAAEEQRRQALAATKATPGFPAAPLSPPIPAALQTNNEEDDDEEDEHDAEEEKREELPAWLTEGLVCIGCGTRTVEWQNADPGKNACICSTCFKKGVRFK